MSVRNIVQFLSVKLIFISFVLLLVSCSKNEFSDSYYNTNVTMQSNSDIVLQSSMSAGAGVAKKLRGKAVVNIAEDFENKKSEMHYFIQEAQSKRFYRLNFKTGEFPIWFQTGKEIEVTFENDPADDELQVIGSAEVASDVTVDAAAYVTDRRNILVLRVAMTDGAPYLSGETVGSYMFSETNSVAKYYYDNTRGKTSFNGDANNDGQYDIYDVTIDDSAAADCTYTTWGSLADQKAQADHGLSLSNYKHILYILPSNSACGFAGVANVSGMRAWVRSGGTGVIAHELGHNLGLHHASSDSNGDSQFTSGTDSEYGDGSCVMGGANWTFMNSIHMEALGTFSAYSSKVVNATAGTYNLSSLSADPETSAYPQIVKVAVGNTGSYYYFSLRTLSGYDSRLSSTYTRGISVHRNYGTRSLYVKTIAPGESFVDSVNGISVTASGFSSDLQSISMQVSVVCGSAAPTLTLNSSNVFVAAGGSVNVSYSLRSNDNQYCGSTQYNVRLADNSQLTSNAGGVSHSLAPGASVSGSIQLTAASLSSGSVPFMLLAIDTDDLDPQHADVSTAGSLTVDATAPSAPTNLAASISRSTTVNLTWSAATDVGSGVASYEIYRNGVLIATTASTSYSNSNLSVGNYTYSVLAVDRVGLKSPLSASVQVSISSTKKGGGRR